MATKSIYKSIIINDNKSAQKLLSALEKSSTGSSKKVTLRKKCQKITGDKIIEMFGDK